MSRYSITLTQDDATELMKDACGMNPFPIEVRGNSTTTITLSLTLTEEEFVFLSLKYKFISSNEITIVDVVGALINA